MTMLYSRDTMEKKNTFGNTFFDLDEPLFVRGEVIEITGVTGQALDNWTQRGTIDVGTMHRSGRRMYSLADLVEIKIIGDLVNFITMPPGLAAGASKYAVLEGQVGASVRMRLNQISKRDASGKMAYKGTKHETHLYMTLWFEKGKHKIKIQTGTEWLTNYSWPHPFIVVDLDSLIFRMLNAGFDVLERGKDA